MGAAAVAAAMLLAPQAAFAGPDDPALVQFKLPSSDAYADFESMGLNMDHAVENAPGGGVLVSAWVTDTEQALVQARGYSYVKTIHDKNNIDRIRAERDASIADEAAATRALKVNAAGKAGPSAAPGTVRAQRADFYENNVGRFISIEANTTQAQITCTNPTAGTGCSYTGPVLVAEFYDAAGNRMGGGNLGTYIDPDVNPDYYQYHYSIFRIGNKGDGGPDPAWIKVAAPNGDVDTLAAKEWVAKNPPSYAQNFQHGFIQRYYDGPEVYKKMRDLAAEFPTIAQVYDLPEKTTGYQRKAQTMLGYQQASYVTFDANNLPNGSTASLSAANGDRAVVLTSKAWGHEGGNALTAQIVAPTGNDQALSVSLTGNAIRINPATNATGAITSTAAQVIAAINANPAVAALVTASKYRTSASGGVVVPSDVSPLSDLLRAPATIPRGPQTQNLLRIGKTRTGNKVGVFFYCQEHGNEIATSGVCMETAERLVRNYGTDPETTQLVDNLEIFIIPQINGDGSIHSLYDSNRRKNMSNYCGTLPQNDTDPARRNSWGVDMNRNFTIGSIFDGFQGATFQDCLSGNYSGPFETSEPEVRNEIWVQTNFPNIKFINNIHSSGGLFMWPPGAYTPARVPLPYPPYGTLNFFDQAARQVLDGIKSHRGTAILPQQTGPVIDVLYSAAGNSADEAYYAHGIIGYDFEIGATHYNDTGTGAATCGPGQQPPFGPNPSNPCLNNEGKHEGEEFASGNYGLLRSALQYSNDTAPPVVDAEVTADGITPMYSVKFKSNEASSIYYTTDGSTPTTASTEYKPPRARALPLPLQLAPKTTLKWIAHDFKGNTSAVRTQAIGYVDVNGSAGGTVAATLALTMGAPAQFGTFTPGVAKEYTASTQATVISTAGDATLSVADPSATNTGKLVNGTFALTNPVQGLGTLKTWTAPTSNEVVPITFKQAILANEPLRTGTYSKTLTFTLSTTTP
ncbi:M14 family zinc carboxypeptidase [Solirubrobacter soli]|uniref:M14 family zinc carboxypeptidase n=1 Tax=Solirubrobacter soli TaxID=363832 RepID=UPI00042327AF|nr:M14 family zinc carboxypeptidase [Solirubrobacter soli]